MKIVFLDIDGVLNCEGSRSRCVGYRGIDDKKVENLAKIVKATGAEIVLISTWKEDWRKTDKSRQGMMANYLDKKLKKQGLTALDKTRDYVGKRHLSRGEGILDYLMRNEAESYVILDDFQFDYDSCGLTDRYVKTDNYNGGLTEILAQKATEILKRGQTNNKSFADKTVYGVGDISEIKEIRSENRITMFRRSSYYYIKVLIKGREHLTYWSPHIKELHFFDCKKDALISEELHEKLKRETGETEEQKQVRRALQLENATYRDKGKFSRLPLSKRNEILSEIGAVSFEALKSLPSHHLERLTAAHLYDWLHCAGYQNTVEAVEFVENLIKNRKIEKR